MLALEFLSHARLSGARRSTVNGGDSRPACCAVFIRDSTWEVENGHDKDTAR